MNIMIRRVLTGLGVLSMAGLAAAHTHLQSASPAEGSTVAKAPTEFVLTFPEPVRATALLLTKDGGKAQKIETLPKDMVARVTAPAPKLDDGHYTLDWRVAGKDGHVMSGKIRFTIGGKAQAVPADHDKH